MQVIPRKALIFEKDDIFGFLRKDYTHMTKTGNKTGSHLWWMMRQAFAAVAYFSGCRGGDLKVLTVGDVLYDNEYGYWESFTQAKLRGHARRTPHGASSSHLGSRSSACRGTWIPWP